MMKTIEVHIIVKPEDKQALIDYLNKEFSDLLKTNKLTIIDRKKKEG